MAGVKGRSGGAREGSGPKPRPAVVMTETEGMEPLDFLLMVQNSGDVPVELRIRAATAAAQYKHAKVGEGGKKDKKDGAARDAAKTFAALPMPRLVTRSG